MEHKAEPQAGQGPGLCCAKDQRQVLEPLFCSLLVYQSYLLLYCHLGHSYSMDPKVLRARRKGPQVSNDTEILQSYSHEANTATGFYTMTVQELPLSGGRLEISSPH